MEKKNTTQILTKEHENILAVIDALNKECDALHNGKKIDKRLFEQIIGFIRNYADKLHHAKEEDILFKELCKDTVNLHCNPVQQMLYEHDLGRDFVRGIEAGVKENNVLGVIENSRNYAQLLQEHIFKEDNILYPLADECLSKEAKKLMLSKFINIDKSREKEIKKYLSFVKSLKKFKS